MSNEKESRKTTTTQTKPTAESDLEQANPTDEAKEPKLKTAFFITPLGSDDSTVRRNTNGVINAVIRPVLKKHDISLIPPHEIDDPGNITKQIIAQILTADLVIADLTGLNANVMYELAIRHARRLPVIVICQHGTKLPFDIAAERTFFYYNDMAGTVQLTEQLDKTIPIALRDEKPDNPIYNGLETSIIQKITEESDDPVRSYIVEKLSMVDELSSLVKGFMSERRNNQLPPIRHSADPNKEYKYSFELNTSDISSVRNTAEYLRTSLPHNAVELELDEDKTYYINMYTLKPIETVDLKRLASQIGAIGFRMSRENYKPPF